MAHILSVWIAAYGSVFIFFLVAFEAVGLPLPGETALITASMYAGATHTLSPAGIILAASAGAILGGLAGWWLGQRFGYAGLRRYGGRIGLNHRRLAIGRNLVRHHGGKIVFGSRFFALIRNVAPLLAGAGGMPVRRFLLAQGAASFLWSAGYGLAFYLGGKQISRFETAHPEIGFIVIAGIICLAVGGALVAHQFARRIETRIGHKRAARRRPQVDIILDT